MEATRVMAAATTWRRRPLALKISPFLPESGMQGQGVLQGARARHPALRSPPEPVLWLRTDAPAAAPHGDGHAYRPGDRLVMGGALRGTAAGARTLCPTCALSPVTPSGALFRGLFPTESVLSLTHVVIE